MFVAAERTSESIPLPGRLFLLPGLAADERMYVGVRHCLRTSATEFSSKYGVALDEAFITPRLLVPHADETMEAYAQRTAAQLELKPHDVIGGCSFGGMVAAAIARAQPVAGLVLLSSALDSATQVRAAPVLNRVAQKLPFAWVRKFLASDFFLRAVFGAAAPEEIELGRTMLLETPPLTLRRGGALAATYHSRAPILAPAYALHGEEDRVLKAPKLEYCTLVPAAGHGLVVSHPQLVADFLGAVTQKIYAAPGS
ncbi:MAG: alpha/beta hydrolase [Desulfuromonadaceae bacterium]|nr:alpha/beta hydrolase [Desulfuromonas sp.]MDY0185884.1 alpha/beta hydrolase [Desulfuromonadaceae bacterium]